MTYSSKFSTQVRELIDNLKSVCANYGLGNHGNEYTIITQFFLYKFLHDKFVYEIKNVDSELGKSDNWEQKIKDLSDDEYEFLTMKLNEGTAVLRPEHLISNLFTKQNQANFAHIFDKTLIDIARDNKDIFSVSTGGGEKISLFEDMSKYVTDNRDDFFRAMINKLVALSFENVFSEGFDFFSTIFEYLIKDYNSDSGGKYAEYFTPHVVSGIMARCLVPDHLKENITNVSCYDPSAGSGTLLMNIAHQIGNDRCSIYSQDISQKSSSLLRLNLILNNLVHSIHNIIQGNTLIEPAHKNKDRNIQTFDYVVSNPPFKLDFSEFRDDLDSKDNNERFFAGIPKIPPKKKESMAIYLVFLQHVIFSLKPEGKAAIVVPTGFITARTGIEKKIREKLVENKMLSGVISMPSNIFATTNTNVSVLFIDKTNKDKVILIDASNLGEKIKEEKNQKTVLNIEEIEKIIKTFTYKEVIDDFSVLVSYEEIKEKNFSFSAGQHFKFKVDYEDISKKEFDQRIRNSANVLNEMSNKSVKLNEDIQSILRKIKYE